MTLEEDQATGISNMHKTFGKDRACGSTDILTDGQTHTNTETYSTQYFATAPAGKINIDPHDDKQGLTSIYISGPPSNTAKTRNRYMLYSIMFC